MLRTSSACSVYHVPGIANAFSGHERVAALFAAGRVLPLLPPRLDESERDRGGWAWPDGHKGPLLVGPYCVFSRRLYHKTIPASLVKIMVQERANRWCEENKVKRAPKVVRAQLREDVEEELLARASPSVRDTPILIDEVRERIYVFTAASEWRANVWSALRALADVGTPWRNALGEETASRVTLWSYLLRIRPGADLPSDVGARFLAWLFAQAVEERWFLVRPKKQAAEEAVRWGAMLDNTVELVNGDCKVAARGDLDLGAFVEHASDERPASHLRKLKVQVLAPDDRRYVVTFDEVGAAVAIRIVAPIALDDDAGHLGDVADQIACATDWHYAHELILAIYATFDATVIAPMLRKAPQTQMWPGGPAAVVDDVVFDQAAPPNACGSPDTDGGIHTWDKPVGRIFTSTSKEK